MRFHGSLTTKYVNLCRYEEVQPEEKLACLRLEDEMVFYNYEAGAGWVIEMEQNAV